MPSAAPPAGLQRRIGLFGAAASGVGIVLGAGIYVLIGEAAGLAGNAVWAAFLVGALLAAGTGLSYAELSAMFPEAGAASAYAREAFGRRAAFVTGWMDVTVNVVGAPAVALGFGGYLAALTGFDRTMIAGAVLLLCALVVAIGVAETVGLAALFAAIEVAGLLYVAVVGAPHLGAVDLLELHGGTVGLMSAAALVFFAYEGFEEIATLAEEVIDPARNIPRAFLIAIGVTASLYVLVSAVAVSVVPWERLGGTTAPLALVVNELSGRRAADVLSLVALFATFNTVLLLLATGSRQMYGMARHQLLPSILGTVWARRGTPVAAIALTTAVSLVFVASGDIAFVAQVTNVAVFTLFVVVNGSLIRLRVLQPDRARPFRTRPSLGPVPLPTAIGLCGAVALAFFMQREALLVGLGALALGVALSFVLVHHTTAEAGD